MSEPKEKAKKELFVTYVFSDEDDFDFEENEFYLIDGVTNESQIDAHINKELKDGCYDDQQEVGVYKLVPVARYAKGMTKVGLTKKKKDD